MYYQSKRGVIYTRVSTDKQMEDGTSLDSQVENCMNYAIANGIGIVKTFREQWSGYDYRNRKMLSEVRRMARSKEIDCIIIYAFDRLSRNQTHMAVLIDEFTHVGVEVLCVREKLDDSPQGKFLLNAMSFVAEVQREKTLELTDQGRRRRISEGKIMPGWKPKYGYVWIGEKKEAFGINETEVAVIRRIFHLYVYEKKSLLKIATMLTEEGVPTPAKKASWSDSTVRHILRDPIYTGYAAAFRYDSKKGANGKHRSVLKPQEEWLTLPEGVTPRIIDDVLFAQAQEQMRLNGIESPRNSGYTSEALLRCGFIRCGYCNRAMSVSGGNIMKRKLVRRGIEYRCPYKHQSSMRCSHAPTISTKRMDEAVWSYVQGIVEDFTMIEQAINLLRGEDPDQPDLKAVEHSIKIVKNAQEQLTDDLRQVNEEGYSKLQGRARQLVLDDLERFEKRLIDLEKERLSILAGQGNWKKMQEDVDKFVAWCLTVRNAENVTYEEKRLALRVLGIQVTVYREDDPEHKRYEIKVRIPNIASHTS